MTTYSTAQGLGIIIPTNFSTLCAITVVILYATLTWIVGLASYLQLRSKTARDEAEWKMRNRMDYFRLN